MKLFARWRLICRKCGRAAYLGRCKRCNKNAK